MFHVDDDPVRRRTWLLPDAVALLTPGERSADRVFARLVDAFLAVWRALPDADRDTIAAYWLQSGLPIAPRLDVEPRLCLGETYDGTPSVPALACFHEPARIVIDGTMVRTLPLPALTALVAHEVGHALAAALGLQATFCCLDASERFAVACEERWGLRFGPAEEEIAAVLVRVLL